MRLGQREKLLDLQDAIASAADDLKRMFRQPDKVKATVIFRQPHLLDGDVVVSEDDLDEVIAAIERLKTRDEVR